MNNIVFYFSGTGNSLKAAKTVAQELGNAEVTCMAKPDGYSLSKQYDTIGFVYPTYFWGLPKAVVEFIKKVKLGENKKTYFYAIATCGGFAANALYQLSELLLEKQEVMLNYGKALRMAPNYVIEYEMFKNAEKINKKALEKLVLVINSIKRKKGNRIKKFASIFKPINKKFLDNVSTMDKNYTINDECNGCGICKEVCPVKNIQMVNNRPEYNHNCENCLACLQYCPKKAINYSNKTQNRKRYTNPGISHRELAESNSR